MKKRKRTMLILLLALAVLLVGYFVIVKVQEAQQEKKENDSVEETVYVTELEDVVALKYTDGTNTLSFVKKEKAWLYEADESLDLDESAVEAIATTLGNIYADRVLEEPDALADYGLETPAYTIEMEDSVGNHTIVYIGNSMDSGYYATVGDKELVYTISSSVVSGLQWDVNELVYVEETTETSEETVES
ncbi:MAG: DUF4340 domain-containing protein [Faecalimonas sp.]|nr:DUF4340 domain-containing protein [Faecalimonas sp.]